MTNSQDLRDLLDAVDALLNHELYDENNMYPDKLGEEDPDLAWLARCRRKIAYPTIGT